MKEIQYEIVKEIAVLSASDSGYTKESVSRVSSTCLP